MLDEPPEPLRGYADRWRIIRRDGELKWTIEYSDDGGKHWYKVWCGRFWRWMSAVRIQGSLCQAYRNGFDEAESQNGIPHQWRSAPFEDLQAPTPDTEKLTT